MTILNSMNNMLPSALTSSPSPTTRDDAKGGVQDAKAGASAVASSSSKVAHAGDDSFESSKDSAKAAGAKLLGSLGEVIEGSKSVASEAGAQTSNVGNGLSQMAGGAAQTVKAGVETTKDAAKSGADTIASGATSAKESAKSAADSVKESAKSGAATAKSAADSAKESAKSGAATANNVATKATDKSVKLGNVVQDAANDSKENVIDTASKGKNKAADVLSKGKGKLHEGVDTVRSKMHQAGASTLQGAENIQRNAAPAARGVLSTLATPFTWTATKVAGAAKNAAVAHPGEIISPRWGYAAVAASTLGYALATAGSWGATLFITTPALAATVGTLGTLFLLQKLATRLLKGAPTPLAAEGGTVTTQGRLVHQTITGMEQSRTASITTLQTEKAALLKKQSTLVGKFDKLRTLNSAYVTQLTELEADIATLESRKIVPAETVIMSAAQPTNMGTLPDTTKPNIKVVATSADIVQGNNAEMTPETHIGNVVTDKSVAASA